MIIIIDQVALHKSEAPEITTHISVLNIYDPSDKLFIIFLNTFACKMIKKGPPALGSAVLEVSSDRKIAILIRTSQKTPIAPRRDRSEDKNMRNNRRGV